MESKLATKLGQDCSVSWEYKHRARQLGTSAAGIFLSGVRTITRGKAKRHKAGVSVNPDVGFCRRAPAGTRPITSPLTVPASTDGAVGVPVFRVSETPHLYFDVECICQFVYGRDDFIAGKRARLCVSDISKR